eukprot:TRINITY_DN21275_c1_g1_i1.p1 TRINITY_DN21275_c1_g1~~TRINITY_DN21275_c1_g1_i1.p1  ORF type:complete len:150 (-),score=34.85 TRINITY_DN21275_c1_g1_i1:374-823(-)
MTNVKAKASLEMNPVPQQDVSADEQYVPCSKNVSDQGGALKHPLCSSTASAQGGAATESKQDSAKEKREAADTTANADLKAADIKANEDLEVVPRAPQEDFQRASFPRAALCPSSQNSQQRFHSEKKSDGDGEIGSNLVLADVPGKLLK